jgi:8-oxo-dGTP pyrophosphatase MutT (NUDIX family)
VSFPGGTEDPEDAGDMVETALRETAEEIGLERSKIQVMGLFDEALSINGLYVTPVVAFCGDYEPESFKPSQDEIDDIFVVTIEDLTAPGARLEENLRRGKIARFVKCPYPVRFPDDGILSLSLSLSLSPRLTPL